MAPADERAANRLVGMLARKGYPAGVAYQVVREALRERGVDDLPEAEAD
jgi:regulatory protein